MCMKNASSLITYMQYTGVKQVWTHQMVNLYSTQQSIDKITGMIAWPTEEMRLSQPMMQQQNWCNVSRIIHTTAICTLLNTTWNLLVNMKHDKFIRSMIIQTNYTISIVFESSGNFVIVWRMKKVEHLNFQLS